MFYQGWYCFTDKLVFLILPTIWEFGMYTDIQLCIVFRPLALESMEAKPVRKPLKGIVEGTWEVAKESETSMSVMIYDLKLFIVLISYQLSQLSYFLLFPKAQCIKKRRKGHISPFTSTLTQSFPLIYWEIIKSTPALNSKLIDSSQKEKAIWKAINKLVVSSEI
jgi:hypothetical protein